MRTVKLITCNESFQARLIKGALENEGIAVAIHNENTSSVLRGMPVSITGIDLFVYEDDYEKAMSILENNQMITERLIYCPYCGSKNIKFALRKKHRLRAIVSMVRRSSVVVSFLFGAMVFREKNLKSKAVDLLLVLISMLFLYLGNVLG